MSGSRIPLDLEDREIRIIGPKRSGKTTYLAALADSSNLGQNTPIQAINPFNQEAADLKHLASDFLRQGIALASTDFNRSPELYTFLITLKPRFQDYPLVSLKGGEVRLNVSCLEYAGELVAALRSSQRSANPTLRNYLDDCAQARGFMLLIDAKSNLSDREYAEAFRVLEQELNDRITHSKRPLRDHRLAIVFTKGEMVWSQRDNIDTFVGLKFCEVQRVITTWQSVWNCAVNYFFCSAFGMRGNPPRPNVRVVRRSAEGVQAVIDMPNVWRPWGLVAPLYLLQTGKDDPTLRKI